MKNILNSKTLVLAAMAALFLTVYCKKDKDNTMTVTDVDGNVYKTVKIGNQIWMAENLRTTKYRNGESIQLVTEPNAWIALNTGAFQPSYEKLYGSYYNWYAVMDKRKLAPEGWHVATDADYAELINELGGSAVAGGKLKAAGTEHWIGNPSTSTNEWGFSAMPAGDIWAVDGTDNGQKYAFLAWTTDLYPGTIYPTLYFMNNENSLDKTNSKELAGSGTTPARLGLSVRCVKDK